MKAHLLLLGVIACSAVAQADKGADRQRVQDLLTQSAHAIDISSVQAFLIRGNLRLLNLQKGEAVGEFGALIAPQNREHVQINLPGIEEHVWVQDQVIWRHGPEKPPGQLTAVEDFLQLRDLLRADYSSSEYKLSDKKVDNAKQSCLTVTQHHAEHFSFCSDEATHLPSKFTFDGFEYQLSHYRQVGSGFFPFSFRVGHYGQEIISGTVNSATALTDASAAVTPPKELPPHAGPACGGEVAPEHVSKEVWPEYPPVAKAARIQGRVVLGLDIDSSGKVTSVNYITGHPMLVSAAEKAAAQWEFKPLICDGINVGSHRTLTINFTLSGG